jgi:ATP-dependent DNA helicase RecG
MIERGVTSFEVEIVPGAKLDDINWERAKVYARSLSGMGEQDVEKILERRGCLVRLNGDLRPTNAGILLFGADPQRHIRGSEITAARFAGDRMGDVFNREDIIGTLPEQIRRAETFLKDHVRKGVILSGDMERKEQLEYPMEAARELVVNAVAHRDYSIAGDGVRLFLFRDHMEVSSPGGLAGHVTVDNIKDERFSRNPVIVQVLADMGFIERLGYGVDRVLDLVEAENLRKPEFRETDGGFRVTLFRADYPITFAPKEQRPTITDPLKDIDEPLNPRQEIAVRHLRAANNNRITNSDLQELCPGVHAETIRRDLADLVTKNILVKKGQKRGSYYVLHTAYQVGRDVQL